MSVWPDDAIELASSTIQGGLERRSPDSCSFVSWLDLLWLSSCMLRVAGQPSCDFGQRVRTYATLHARFVSPVIASFRAPSYHSPHCLNMRFMAPTSHSRWSVSWRASPCSRSWCAVIISWPACKSRRWTRINGEFRFKYRCLCRENMTRTEDAKWHRTEVVPRWSRDVDYWTCKTEHEVATMFHHQCSWRFLTFNKMSKYVLKSCIACRAWASALDNWTCGIWSECLASSDYWSCETCKRTLTHCIKIVSVP